MNILTEHLAALTNLGYNEQEARFLYLAATHSGYFTLRQYLDFTGTTKGWNVHQFTSKAIRMRHARVIPCGRQTSLFNLYSRKIYGALDRENLRNRRRLSSELIRTRLLILDFVLAHPEYQYLETEYDKVHFFRDQLGLPETLLPGRTYKGIRSNSTTKRYFVDRFPIFLTANRNSNAGPIPTFIYCDPSDKSLLPYITHLRQYEPFLRRLPAFEFLYASSTTAKFRRIERFFRDLFDESCPARSESIYRYFCLRRLWEENQHGALTRSDRDLLRQGNRCYKDEFYEELYRKWTQSNSFKELFRHLPNSAMKEIERPFHIHLLPRDYNIFATGLQAGDRTPLHNERSAPRSDSRSTEDTAKDF